MKKSLKQKIAEVVSEDVSVVPYDPEWSRLFDEEAEFLWNTLPTSLVKKIEHFGSTAVLELAAKPIIDILVEVSSLDETKKQIVPLLESEGYDYFWRPLFNTPCSPRDYYAFFIRRNSESTRTHHIHMVEADSILWDRLYFRDYLREFPDEAKRYAELKLLLCEEYPNDRIAYTEDKTDYITLITEKAKHYYNTT